MTETITSTRTLARVAPTPAATPTRSELADQIAYATTISDAAAVLPDHYRKSPGAVMLAKMWADARGLDLLTTIQNVAFVKGRPVVDATMQRALAHQAGYRVVPELAADRKSCTAVVTAPDGATYRHTYTLEDAKVAGLLGKDNWRMNPGAMLVAAASRHAVRMFAPEVLLGVFDRDEIDDEGRVHVDLIAATPIDGPSPSPVPEAAPEPAPEPEPDGAIEDAEIVIEGPTDMAEPAGMTVADFRAEIKARGHMQTDAIKAARGLGVDAANLQVIVDAGRVDDVLAALSDGATEEPF